MPQDPNPVKIEVTSSADLGAVEKTKEALEQTKKSTEDLAAAEAKRAADEKAHAEWLADHQKRQEQYAAKAKENAEAAAVAMSESQLGPKRDEAAEELAFLERQNKAAEERNKLLDGAIERLENFDEAANDAASSGAGLNEQTGQFNKLLASQALGQAAEFFKGIASNLEKMGDELKTTNPELAQMAKEAAQTTSALSSVLGGAGIGAAAGGPLGAAVGALAGGLTEVAKRWIEVGIEGQKANAGLREAIEANNRSLAEQRGLMAATEVEAWIASLDAGTAAINRQADALDRKLGLMRAERIARAEVESAGDALDLARIDADKNLSEEEKIRARAGITERGARRRAQGQLDDLNDKDIASAGRAKQAQDVAKDAARKQTEIETRLAEAEEEKAKLRARQAAAAEAKREADKLEQEANNTVTTTTTSVSGVPVQVPDVKAEKKVRAMREEVERLRKEAGLFGLADQKRLDQLQGDGEGSEDALRKGADKAAEKTIAARKAAQEAAEERAQERAENEAAARGVLGSYQLGREARGITAGSSADQARERAEEQRLREEERRQKDAERQAQREARAQAKVDTSNLSAAASNLKGAGGDEVASALREVSGAMREIGEGVTKIAADTASAKRAAQEAKHIAETVAAKLKRGGNG